MLGHRLGPVSTKMFDAVCKMQASRNLDADPSDRLRSRLEQNGKLEDIHEEKNMMLHKTEEGNLGKAVVDNTKNVFRNMKPALQPILGITSEEYDEMMNVFGRELEDNASYLDVCRAYGRKKNI
ncbi:13970_t:CDS:2 [Acaulospora morrowiae]|uniref:13970_t:CDS:1 n=1 Tax=Acaulospora morrowiae TaxID=94023 RepID=A0A9N8Z9J8_9GLOM|nr:13970_t:CDS:2 [Acaulospora morrowiae]